MVQLASKLNKDITFSYILIEIGCKQAVNKELPNMNTLFHLVFHHQTSKLYSSLLHLIR